jgi:hypothetical protein
MEPLELKLKALEQLQIQFEDELKTLQEIARVAHEAATHEEAKSEDKHDTRAIEASYLAKGQARRAQEIDLALKDIKGAIESVGVIHSRISDGTLVHFELEGEPILALVSRHGGGKKLVINGRTLQIVNPASPLGEALEQLKAGDHSTLVIKSDEKEILILSVQ